MNYVNKDTELYGSFSKTAGNNGCKIFNTCFRYYNMNAIYKSFSIDDIQSAVIGARALKFKGFAVSMPFKTEVLKYVDDFDESVTKIGSANTVINKGGALIAYNTDYLAVKEFLSDKKLSYLVILGNGGFASAVKFACKELSIEFKIIDRNSWKTIQNLKNCSIFNCTPVENIKVSDNVIFFDARPTTEIGALIAKKQARYQFELYTNKKFPLL